jgi:hypothetical protein
MNHNELITDGNAFSRLRDECSVIIHINKRLPEQVFRQKFAEYFAFEHGMTMRAEFAMFLTNIASGFGDRAVNYMTLDPDPVEFYHKNCGFYGLASFEPSSLIDNYIRVMSRDGEPDSFRTTGGDVAVMWGSSLGWGIFCDRRSWELCLMASFSPIDQSLMRMVRKDAFQVRSYLLNEYQHKPQLALEFLRDLAKSYPMLR